MNVQLVSVVVCCAVALQYLFNQSSLAHFVLIALMSRLEQLLPFQVGKQAGEGREVIDGY